MAVPKTKLWKCDRHTIAKHRILDRYLQAWFPIIARSYPSLTYVEGFAGPNEYEDGEPGSPTYALSQAMKPSIASLGKELRLVFIEVRQDRLEHLAETIESSCPASERPRNLAVTSHRGDCGEDLVPLLTSLHAWKYPIFANLDGFGADVPFALVSRLGKNVSSEVLVTLAPSFFVRFANVEDLEAGDLVFGNRDWRRVQNCASPDEKWRFLVSSYRESLRRAGFKWVLHFEMTDEGGHRLYLFFATSVELAPIIHESA